MSWFDPGAGWRMEQFPDEVPPGVVAFREDDGSWSYWVREVPVSPLPTEPGYYVADEPGFGGTVVVELLNRPSGQWVDAGDRNYLDGETVRAMGPLVRLEPRAVTAKAVLERVNDILDGETPWVLLMTRLAREFGVTE